MSLMCRRITIKLVVSCGASSHATAERIAALEKHNALVWCAHYGGRSTGNFRLDSDLFICSTAYWMWTCTQNIAGNYYQISQLEHEPCCVKHR